MTDGAPDDGDSSLPEQLRDDLSELGERELRAVVDYAQQRISDLHQPMSSRIEAGPGEELVRVVEHDGYTEVVKREPCATGCESCPHAPVLYHVRAEARTDGSTHLRWTYLGQIMGTNRKTDS